jgi:hypothetical protein
MDVVIAFNINQRYYDFNFKVTDQTYAIMLICFTLTDNKDDLSELKKSKNFWSLFTFLANIINTYFIYYHFKNRHLNYAKEIDNLEKLDVNKILLDLLVDFILFFDLFNATMLIKYFYSKKRKSFFLINILKRMILMIFVTIIFYANYNSNLNEFIYNKFRELVPQPHSVVIYNLFPVDADIRFKMITIVFCYLIM